MNRVAGAIAAPAAGAPPQEVKSTFRPSPAAAVAASSVILSAAMLLAARSLRPEPYRGPSVGSLARLAEAVAREPRRAPLAELLPPPTPPRLPDAAAITARSSPAAPNTAPSLRSARQAGTAPEAHSPAPARRLALLGVAGGDDAARAWVINRETQERAVVGVGESAFGLTVTGIEPDHVDVVEGSARYELRVGSEGLLPVDPDETEGPHDR